MTENKRIRRTVAGFVGANLAGPDGDLTLYNRLVEEKKNTTMSHSLIIRLALQEYFDRKDSQKKD
jgi:hypothetical protein